MDRRLTRKGHHGVPEVSISVVPRAVPRIGRGCVAIPAISSARLRLGITLLFFARIAGTRPMVGLAARPKPAAIPPASVILPIKGARRSAERAGLPISLTVVIGLARAVGFIFLTRLGGVARLVGAGIRAGATRGAERGEEKYAEAERKQSHGGDPEFAEELRRQAGFAVRRQTRPDFEQFRDRPVKNRSTARPRTLGPVRDLSGHA